MAIKTTIIFFIGFLAAVAMAIWQYTLTPEGVLIYTPVQGSEPNYTSSSALGFLLIDGVLCVLSAVTSLICAFYGAGINRSFLPIAKHSGILAVAFGLLAVLVIVTEPIWP